MTPAQLKGRIKNEAASLHISPQQALQNYVLGCLMTKIAESKYRENFIIKGGYLISSLIGLENRTTMDIDATISALALTEENIRKIFSDITDTPIAGMTFSIDDIAEIRDADLYGGLRVKLHAHFDPLDVALKVDLSAGDVIYPGSRQVEITPLFSDRAIQVYAYTVETILAEKIETLLRRSILNTRAKDFYDVYILKKIYADVFDPATLKEAFVRTFTRRQSMAALNGWENTLRTLVGNPQLNEVWTTYRNLYSYAAEIPFSDTIAAAEAILQLCDSGQ